MKKSRDNTKDTKNQGKLFLMFGLGIALLLAPIALVYCDVLQRYINYLLRMDNGTILHDIMLRRLPSVKFKVYMFNVTNAEQFLTGADEKVKLEEVGPFVYQEMRTNEDLEVNIEPGIMRLTPKLEFVFVPEESIAHPNETYLTLPNFPMLSITSLIGKYPYLVQRIHNLLVTSTGSKAFKKINLQDMFWGYHDPIIALANRIAPGLVYFKTFGLLQRLFDVEKYDYRLELTTSNEQKFVVRKSIKTKPKHPKKENEGEVYVEKTLTFDNNTFEGAVFPPNLPPGFPINIYRTGYCQTLKLLYTGTKPMAYGGDGLAYTLDPSVTNDKRQCYTTGWCPGGLMDAAPCYFDLPLVVSKGHFLDADPRLLDKLEGLRPDRNRFGAEMIIDPKIGVVVSVAVSAQVSLFLANMEYNPQSRRLHDTVLPIVRYQIESSPLSSIPEAEYALKFIYKLGPYTILATQIVFVICGLALLAYSVRMARCSWQDRRKKMDFINSTVQRPLIIK